jgi:hypothetical protein
MKSSVVRTGILFYLAGSLSFSNVVKAEPIAQTELNPPIAASQVIKILNPAPNAIVDIPATSVVLQFPLDVGKDVDLRVNGVPADRALIGRTETDTKNNLITQTWYGLSLKEGENTLTAQVKGGEKIIVKVFVRGIPKKITVKPAQAKLPADGRSTVVLEGQLLDEQGNRSDRDAMVTLTSSAGEFTGTDADPDQAGFQVKVQKGQYAANLRSNLEAQVVKVEARAAGLAASSQLEFETSLRPSLVTGVVNLRLGAQGTDYYRSFRDFLPPDRNNSTKLDLRSAVFATGKVGDWLFTGAYNNSRSLNLDCNDSSRLYQDVQSCDQPYPVFGDSSTTERTAQSKDSLFLRLERNQDSALWGDYDTAKEFATNNQQLTALSRQLHGLKLNYNFGNLQLTGLYGDNVQGFQRDTIAPDGTSGYYFVSRRLLLVGSEQIAVELEELNRPGTVIERKLLSRSTDYDIDYDRGAILLRSPLLRTEIGQDGRLLVRRLVATYQYESRENANIYGARARYHFSKELNRESWLGTTYVKENQGVRTFELYGADALFSLGPNSKLIAEYAHSNNDSEVVGPASGSAFRVEFDGELSKEIKGHAYLRAADSGFANNATISFVPGQTRYGVDLTAQVSPTTNVKVQYDREDNKGIAPQPRLTFTDLFNPGPVATPGTQVDNSLTTFTAGVAQQLGSSKLEVDLLNRTREDRLQPDIAGNSSQLRSRLTVPVTDKVTFRAQNELNLSPRQDLSYPDRTILGLEWAVYPGIRIQLNQQFFSGGQFGSNSITSLDTLADYKLGENTTLTGRYSVISGANGPSNQGALGLNQRLVLSPGLTANLNYEHVLGNVFANTGAGLQFAQPYAVGQSASALGIQSGDNYGLGFEYTANPDFKASARYEKRTSGAGDNTVITAGVTGKLSPSLTALLRYNQANSANQLLTGLADTKNLKLGLAYRNPKDNSFNALLRYEYRQNPSVIPNTILFGSGTGSADHTVALEAIYAPNWQWEFYGKYALRSSTTNLAQDFSVSSMVSLAQLRARYRLGYNTDLVGEIRSISQPTAGYSEIGGVAELGYYLSPNLRLAGGYSFGSINNDRDFTGTRYAAGPYLGITLKVNELFDGFGLQQAAPAQQQESQLAKSLPPVEWPKTVTAPLVLPPKESPKAATVAPSVSQAPAPTTAQPSGPVSLNELSPIDTSAATLVSKRFAESSLP